MQKLVAKKSVNKNLEVWTLIFPQSDLRSEAMAISQGGDFFGPWSGPEKKKDFKGEGGFGRFLTESGKWLLEAIFGRNHQEGGLEGGGQILTFLGG